MSTKPPMAVRMPRATAKTFFTTAGPAGRLQVLQVLGRAAQVGDQVAVPLAVAGDDRDARVGDEAGRLVERVEDLRRALPLHVRRLHRRQRLRSHAAGALGVDEHRLQVGVGEVTRLRLRQGQLRGLHRARHVADRSRRVGPPRVLVRGARGAAEEREQQDDCGDGGPCAGGGDDPF